MAADVARIDLTPTAAMAAAAKRGLALLADGKGGDGLVDRTIADARRMAARDALSERKVRAMPGWFARHATDKTEGWNKPGSESPGFVAFLLWGGETAAAWATSKVKAIDKQDKKARAMTTRRAIDGSREMLCAPFTDIEVRQSGDPNLRDYFTLAGHAAVFGDTADLGSFRETIEPGSFARALETSTVHLVWNHNMDFPLASTDSGTLDLIEDETGLRVWARVPKQLSWANDLRTLMETGIATGMSFAFTLPEDGSGEVWTRGEDGKPERTITAVSELYDVSATPRGAYSAPQYSMRSIVDEAINTGRLPDPAGTNPNPVARPDQAEGGTDTAAEPMADGMPEPRANRLASLKADAARRRRIAAARNNH